MNVTAKPQRLNRRSQKPKNKNGNGNKPKLGKAFVATATTQRVQVPRITSQRNSRRIIHRELVQSVNGSVGFTATKLVLNPGMATTFPWLSSQADGWEQYRFNRLKFEYVTRTSTATLGSIILSPDYDAADPAPTTEAMATSYMDCVEDATWKDITCQLSPSAMFPMGPRKYIRTSEVPGSKKVFDAGNLWLCTVEEVGTDAIGKLWVEYDVELFVPQTIGADGATSLSVYSNSAATQTFATAVAELVDFVTVVDGLGWGAQAVGVWTPPKGTYTLCAVITGTDDTAEKLTVLVQVVKNAALLTPHQGGFQQHEVTTGGDLQATMQAVVTCSGTDTVGIELTLTGAAGVLTVQRYFATLQIQVV